MFSVLTPALAIFSFAVYTLLVGVLVAIYVKTRNRSFLWLTAAVVWPHIGGVLQSLALRSALDPTIRFFPFSLVRHGQVSLGEFAECSALLNQLITVGLLLITVFYLYRTVDAGKRQLSPRTVE